MKTLTKMAAWVGAAALVAVPSAHAAPVHATDSLNPAATAEVSSEEANGEVTPFIVGGNPADIANHPWQVYLQRKQNSGGTKESCAGFLVSEDIVISAEHCFEKEDDVKQAIVWYGSTTRRQGSSVRASNWITGDQGQDRYGDWAVLKLDNPLPNRTYLNVANHNRFNDGPNFKVAGWGRTTEEGSSVDDLREVNLPFVPDDVCGEDEENICAGVWGKGLKDTCKGDSGGALVRDVAGLPVAVGITSHGRGCGRPKDMGKYTEISTYWDDIIDVVDELDGVRPNPAPDF